MGDMDINKLVFLDEAGFCTGLSRNYGWAKAGTTPVIEKPMRGKRITAVGAIAADGPRALTLIDGSFNGERFKRFLAEDLGPQLNSGDIVVMDGPKIHRVEGVAQILETFGAVPLYLPAYSPEYNPIEMAWELLKGALRRASIRKVGILVPRIRELWAKIQADVTTRWILHCGYAVPST